ncbi:MAG TPA: AAA family ATPase [Candidatus Dormibacteraeota bacterium]|nr:AAA family ATPase [Candidatus Dormibacteraeota bacterium]
MLRKISLLRERVDSWDVYPFSVHALHNFTEISFRSRICFFCGENGSGKSTLLEAIAAHYGSAVKAGHAISVTIPRTAIAPSSRSSARCECPSTAALARAIFCERKACSTPSRTWTNSMRNQV